MIVALLVIVPAPQLAMTEGIAPIGLASLSQVPARALEDRAPLLQAGSALTEQRRAMFDTGVNRTDVEAWTKAPSLFAGQTDGSMFAPVAPRPVAVRRVAPLGGTAVDQLRHIIGQAESRHHGYDAVQHGARVKPGKRPTDMTLAEIFDWIETTPGQPHAIGRYQFIPSTLEWLVGRLGVRETAVFSPALQDRLADLLLADAGFHDFQRGELSQEAFMNNLAQIWAGLPTSEGVSYYDGYAGNRASLSWEEFDAQMAQITW